MKNRSNYWELGENVLLFGAGVGSVASVVAQQAFYAAAPLSFLFLLNLVNRRRFERTTHSSITSTISKVDQQLSGELHALRQQVAALPNHNELAGVKKALTKKQLEMLTSLREDVLKHLRGFEKQHLTDMRNTIDTLKKQQLEATDSIQGLSGYLHRLAPASKLDSLESVVKGLSGELTQLQSALQRVINEPKPNFNAFQDQINHINRRLNNLPPPFDPSALKQDVEAVIKLAGDLVPKREMARLLYEIDTIEKQMATFEKTITPFRVGATVLKKQLDTVVSWMENSKMLPTSRSNAELDVLQAKVADLYTIVETLQSQPDFLSSGSIELDISELAEFAGITDLDDIDLDQQLADIIGESSVAMEYQTGSGSQLADSPLSIALNHQIDHHLAELVARVELLEQTMPADSHNPVAPDRTIPASSSVSSTPDYTLMFALQDLSSPSRPANPRSLLETILDQAEESLMVVLPSLTHCNFSQELSQKIQAFLERGGQITMGLGYMNDSDYPLHDRCLDAYWRSNAKQQGIIYKALNRLTQLKQTYPQQFTFKVLGTDENFLIYDRKVAVLGVQSLTVASDLYPGLELGLRTQDARVIQGLCDRFEHPRINNQDAAACFNRAITCHEIGDYTAAITYYTYALDADPNHTLAYCYRGVAYCESKAFADALGDFLQAVTLDPNNATLQFNMGYIHAEMGDRVTAIEHFSYAIELDPNFPAAYFHRGLANTREGNKHAAIDDYNQVLSLDPMAGIAYFYRGLAYTKINRNWSALKDFQQAVALFTGQKNAAYLDKARIMLKKLEALAPSADAEPIAMSSATAIQPVPPLSEASIAPGPAYVTDPSSALNTTADTATTTKLDNQLVHGHAIHDNTVNGNAVNGNAVNGNTVNGNTVNGNRSHDTLPDADSSQEPTMAPFVSSSESPPVTLPAHSLGSYQSDNIVTLENMFLGDADLFANGLLQLPPTSSPSRQVPYIPKEFGADLPAPDLLAPEQATLASQPQDELPHDEQPAELLPAPDQAVSIVSSSDDAPSTNPITQSDSFFAEDAPLPEEVFMSFYDLFPGESSDQVLDDTDRTGILFDDIFFQDNRPEHAPIADSSPNSRDVEALDPTISKTIATSEPESNHDEEITLEGLFS